MIEVFDVRVEGEASAAVRVPAACRRHLWHAWVRTSAEDGSPYVWCERCHRLPSPTIFEPPLP